jgi:hypothetical protein
MVLKNITILLIIQLIITDLSAQIIIDKTDLPDIGDVQISVRVDNVQSISLSPGLSGENVKWDYRNLLPCCTSVELSFDTISWVDPQSTPNEIDYPLSNLADQMNCSKYHSHATHQDELKCNYFYYIKNNSGLLFYGNDAQNNMIINPYYNVFPLLQYGDSINNIARIMRISKDTIYSSYIVSNSKADAFGVLITPSDSVNSLRIFTRETVFDSMYINGIGSLVKVVNDNYYYRWYAKKLGYPVLEIYKGYRHLKRTDYQSVFYAKKQEIASGLDEMSIENSIRFFPNPFTDVITLENNIVNNDKINLIIFNSFGKVVYELNNVEGNQTIIINEIKQSGIYFYKIVADGKIINTGKLLKM